MKKRLLVIGMLLLLGTGGLMLLPTPRYALIGTLRGESFYRGRPTSYWAAELQTYEKERIDEGDFSYRSITNASAIEWINAIPTAPSGSWFDSVKSDFSAIFHPRSEAPLLWYEGHPEAVPVLVELLQHENRVVRAFAVRGLGKVGPGSEDALPAVLAALHDTDPVVRETAIHALQDFRSKTRAALEAACPVLEAIAQNNNEDEHLRTTALQVLGRPITEVTVPDP